MSLYMHNSIKMQKHFKLFALEFAIFKKAHTAVLDGIKFKQDLYNTPFFTNKEELVITINSLINTLSSQEKIKIILDLLSIKSSKINDLSDIKDYDQFLLKILKENPTERQEIIKEIGLRALETFDKNKYDNSTLLNKMRDLFIKFDNAFEGCCNYIPPLVHISARSYDHLSPPNDAYFQYWASKDPSAVAYMLDDSTTPSLSEATLLAGLHSTQIPATFEASIHRLIKLTSAYLNPKPEQIDYFKHATVINFARYTQAPSTATLNAIFSSAETPLHYFTEDQPLSRADLQDWCKIKLWCVSNTLSTEAVSHLMPVLKQIMKCPNSLARQELFYAILHTKENITEISNILNQYLKDHSSWPDFYHHTVRYLTSTFKMQLPFSADGTVLIGRHSTVTNWVDENSEPIYKKESNISQLGGGLYLYTPEFADASLSHASKAAHHTTQIAVSKVDKNSYSHHSKYKRAAAQHSSTPVIFDVYCHNFYSKVVEETPYIQLGLNAIGFSKVVLGRADNAHLKAPPKVHATFSPVADKHCLNWQLCVKEVETLKLNFKINDALTTQATTAFTQKLNKSSVSDPYNVSDWQTC